MKSQKDFILVRLSESILKGCKYTNFMTIVL